MAEKQNFNLDWYFHKMKPGISLDYINGTYIPWQPVDVPHDWLIEQVNDLYETSDGWYKKTFYCSDISDYFFSLRFDGIYMNSTIYMNGQKVMDWPYGYSSFDVDLNPYLLEGENTILVCVRHKEPNSRWYSGAGIYRNVWLYKKHFYHFVTDGIYISTHKSDSEGWNVTVSSRVICNTKYQIRHEVIDEESEVLLTSYENTFRIDSPLLWDLEQPHLYKLRSFLIVDGDVTDTQINTFGFREIKLTTDEGFFLNGNHIKLKGVCNHHDLGLLGAAFFTEAAKRQLLILKEMGTNAIRTTHNMPAPELLDLADEMGFLVLDEAFDMWERNKTTYDYACFFKEHSSKDVASWIRRDRNHPSVILWSIGNEIYDTHVDAHGEDITRYLMEEVKKYDPYENAYVTICSNYMPWEHAQACADIVKIAGYNYCEKFYATQHKAHPDWIIYGSETSSIVQSRGIYHFPLEKAILSDDDLQCSSLGNSATSWGAQNLVDCALTERDTTYSLGQFLWSGFDYIGEPIPYHTKNSYFGQVDTAGFPKDAYYFYQSMWRSFKEFPMLHILPYWDFNDGQLIDIRVFTNAPYVELFLNKISLGMQALDHEKGTKLIGDWKVAYEKGTLTAVAYDENKCPILCKEKHSFSDAKKIVLKAEKEFLLNDGRDLLFLEISVNDENNVPVENATNRITIHVEKGGRLLGVDNGDSTDYDEYQTNNKRLFSGKLLAIIAADKNADTLVVSATSPGLSYAQLTLPVLNYKKKRDLAGFLCCNGKGLPKNEIPIRKIELTSDEGSVFTKEKPSMRIKAHIYPENATYSDIDFRITDALGVEVKSASFEVDPEKKNEIILTAKGDSDFILRAFTKNGTSHISLLSCLNFTTTGLGVLYTNPYEFVSASHYTHFTGDVTSGNERGVATSIDQKTTLTYDNLDFGSYGSDIITLPIFELAGEPTEITFREGKDLSDETSILGQFIYKKPLIWDVYQEDTFQFNRRLKGITSFTIEVNTKIHIKGFTFSRKQKAYEILSVLEADSIYGDSFSKSSDCVTGIGNNVSFVFTDMDFINGIKKLKICGHCPIDQNTIHIRFHGKTESTQLAEFLHNDTYTTQSFDLSDVHGLCEVTFVFLPGSNFDFKWFRFES